MKCKQVQEMMGAYLYGDLAPDEMKEIRLHTAQCDACRADVESRGRVVALLPDKAPELSDEDRMQIAWAVKGAVRNAAAQPGFGWGRAVAVATVVLAGLAVGALVLFNTSKRPPPGAQAQERAPAAAVKIVEIHPSRPKKTPEKTTPTVQQEESSPTKESTPNPDSIAGAIRRAATLAITGSRHPNGKKTVPEKPAAIVEEPKAPEAAPAKEGEKLPKPADTNDAQTTPE